MKKLLVAFAAFLAVPSALAQTPAVQVDRSGVTVQTSQAVSITYGDGYVRISWAPSPSPIPTPTPTPTPNPTPNPTPTPIDPVIPAPIAEPGLRVLMIYDLSKLAAMPSKQVQVLYDQSLRDFMSGATAKNSKGTPEWRVYDQSVDLANESEIWKKAMARPRGQVPWIIVSNGKTGTEEPLPKTPEEARALIQKFAEVK